MTILVYSKKQKQVCVDSLVTTSGGFKAYRKKFLELDDKVIFYTGDVRCGAAGMRRIADGKPPTQKQLDACDFLVFDKASGSAVIYGDTDEPEAVTESRAWGSGADFAHGALFIADDALRAALAACEFSNTCGGKVHTFSAEG
jgi:hypothetical protein